MSRDLRVALFKQRHPPLSHHEDKEYEDEHDELGDLPSFGAGSTSPARAPASFSPLSSDDCFATALEIDILCAPNTHATIRAYYTPPRGESNTVVVCHHGAGFGALSYALMARDVSALSQGELGVLAYDCRGHGRSTFPSHIAKDMSLASLTSDMIAVLQTLFPASDARPSIILLGHSMGGAVAVETAHALERQNDIRVTGVVMIDIVEETSLELLPSMSRIVRQRPEGFVSVASAIQWHVKTRTIRNAESARRSVPSLVHLSRGHAMLPWRWNADLIATEPYWSGWFQGLSSKFLTCRAARLLVLAETDRLDQTLMIGQMQGKYQLSISPHAGHCVQEDAPYETARTLVQFWRRNDRLPPGLRPVGTT